MTTVDTNRLKGNYALNLVATWLSRTCLVRTVTEGTDIGIDLYCESVIQGSPYLHFWVQVKAINNSNISEDHTVAWYDFDTQHLHYWGRQPIPVYTFLVPIETWPPQPPQRIYGIRITEQIIRDGIPPQSTVRLKASDWFSSDDMDQDLAKFISEIVPWDGVALLLRKGIIAPIPEYKERKDQRFPHGLAFKYADKILENIRDTSVVAGFETLMAEHHNPAQREKRKRFEQIAVLFQEELHELGTSFLVRAAHVDGDIPKAKAYVIDALNRVQQYSTMSEEIKRERTMRLEVLLDELASLKNS
jgi:Domain of unknown function (DUF4365)